MCASCGCKAPFDDHGSTGNITLPDLERARESGGVATLDDVARNIAQAVQTPVDPSVAFASAAGKPLIVCDIDETLSFYREAATLAVNMTFATAYGPEWNDWQGPMTADQRNWLTDERENDPDFWMCVTPDTRAIASLRSIFDSGYSVVIATDRPDDMLGVTNVWLDSHGVKRNRTIVGKGLKDIYLRGFGPSRPAILIDDKPLRWATAARPGVEVWSPLRPYTPAYRPANVRVFSDWSEVLGWLSVT